ncbi:hypothetical protein ABBQ38_011641 [Trebouxia sp. C0009 RCD-2024]
MDLDAVLAGCSSNDNATRKQAEQTITAAAKSPEILSQLMQRLQSAEQPQVRQLSGVLLRKHLRSHWRRLPPAAHKQIQTALQQRLVQEPVEPVRRAVAELIASIARLTVPNREWPGLLEWLHQLSSAASEHHRQAALHIFSSLTQVIGEHLQESFPVLQQVFLASLKDSAAEVRRTALQAVASMVPWLDEEPHVALFKDLVPLTIQVTEHAVASGDEVTAVVAFETFLDLLEVPASWMGPFFPALVKLSVQTASNTHLELNTREQALQIVNWLAQFKPKQLSKQQLVKPILEALCKLCAEPEPEDHDQDDQLSANKFASQAIDTLALNLQNRWVFPPCLSFAKEAIQSGDPNTRAAGCTVLVVCAEGCCDACTTHLAEVLQVVVRGLQDSEAIVRSQAAFALGQLAEYCQPDINEHYKELLPGVFHVMHDPNPQVQQQACYALDAFCENLGPEELQGYLEPLMGKLLEVVSTGDADTQETALGAIASAANAAGPSFQPYVQAVFPVLRHYMEATDPAFMKRRCRASEAMGLMATAVGKDAIAPMVQDIMQAALKGMSIDDSELREYTHGLFGSMAAILKQDFQPFLATCVAAALASCNQDDGTFGEDVDSPALVASPGSVSLGTDSSEDEDDEDGDAAEHRMNIRTGVLDEKASASQVLGSYPEHTGALYAPHIQETLDMLLKMGNYFHCQVREQAYIALPLLYTATSQAFPPQPSGEVSRQVQHVVDSALPLMIKAFDTDDDKEAVIAAVLGCGVILSGAGAQACQSFMEPLATGASMILNGGAPCQQIDSEEDDDQEAEAEDEDTYDEELLAAVAELLPIMASALGPQTYGPVFQQLVFQPLMKRFQAGQPDGVRSTMIGALAELGTTLGPNLAEYLPKLLPVLFRELRCDDPGNRRNAAYCAGVVCHHCPHQMQNHIGQLLQALHPLIQDSEHAATQDNAAGAVGRMLSSMPAQLPLDQVLPVLLTALPLKEDFEEAGPVYGALCGLVTNAETAPKVANLMPQLVQALAQACTEDGIPDETKRHVGQTIAHLLQQYTAQMKPLLSSLPPDQQTAVAAFGA